MPIKGVSEIRRLPRIGKIRLGIKTTSQNSKNPYPKAVDYFVCNEDKSTPKAAADAFHAVYGDQPKSIDIMFPSENPEHFFAQFYRRYGSGTGLLCKSDGENATAVDKDTGELLEIECNPDECEWYQKKHCRHIGTLQFLLYKVPGLGIWQIDTTSFHSIVNLNSSIEFVMNLTGGRISGIPLKLIVRPKEVVVEGNKKTVYVLDIASEQIKLEDILKNSMKTPAQILLPELNLNERPDDLIPDEILLPNGTNETESVKPSIKPTTSKSETKTNSLIELMGKSGATRDEIGLILKFDTKNPAHLTKEESDRLIGLFTGDGWKVRLDEIRLTEQAAANL